jgi:hypothetical protein
MKNRGRPKKNIKEIQEEIDHYRPKKSIANAMLELGELGFKFSGHGYGYRQEDFGLFKDKYYFSISDQGNRVVASVTEENENDLIIALFNGTVGKALKFIKSRLELKI